MNTLKKVNEKLKHRTLFYALMALTFGGVMVLSTGPASAADSCQDACNQYTECAGVMMGKSPSAGQKQTLMKGCMQSCEGSHKQGIMGCFATAQKASGSKKTMCQSYSSCIISKMR